MKFSIIVPVYNVEPYLRQCLESIVNQTDSDYEVIVVDDGSTDQCGMICNQYQSKYKQLKVIHQENQGLSGARNTGLKYAKGEWIAFIDSDDWVEENYVEILKNEINRNHVDMLSFNAKKIEDKEESLMLFSPENLEFSFQDEHKRHNFLLYTVLQYKIGWEACTRVYKKEVIDKYNLQFEPTKLVFAEDYLFTFQYLLYAESEKHICNVLYNYRQVSTSLLHSLDKSTVITKLKKLTEEAYKEVEKSKQKYIKDRFYELFFMIYHYHITYLLKDISIDVIQNEIKQVTAKRPMKKWMKQLKKHSYEFEKMLKKRNWL